MKQFLSVLTITLFFSGYALADIKIGSLAGGTLTAVSKNESTEEEMAVSFKVLWKRDSQTREAELDQFSEPSTWADSYSLGSAELNGNNIKVVINRKGSFDYRGDSAITYELSFDPAKLQFSKAKRKEVDGSEKAVKNLRQHLRRNCDPDRSPSKTMIEENLTNNPRDANLVYLDSIYGIVFEEMHACAVELFKKGKKTESSALIAKTVANVDASRDWICKIGSMEEQEDGEPAEACQNRREIFFSRFVSEQPQIANDYGFFLYQNPKHLELANEVLTAVVKHYPKRAVARLNLGDALWDLGKSEDAKVHYREYLKHVPERIKNSAERQKVKQRLDQKPNDLPKTELPK
ncbi:MAG: tetratricopeptide repeat protein [Bdellovibrionota bacterium]